jgi:hypothetical protein
MSYRPIFKDDEYHKPSRHHEIETEKGTILYAHIRKNASTAFKKLYSHENSKIVKVKDNNSKKYAGKVFVYRDPLARFISVFLNKFVFNSRSNDIRANFYSLTSHEIETIKFNDFVEYTQNDFSRIDCHLRPQKSHLWEIKYDKSIDIDDLYESMVQYLGPEKSHIYFSKKINSSHSKGKVTQELLIDKTINDLRKMCNEGVALKPHNFFSSELKEYVQYRYQADYEMISDIQAQR